MECVILTVGDELLIGQVVDTNSAWMATKLNELGVRVREIRSISDSKEAIISALEAAFSAADIVLVTGGLGPTKDDVTKMGIAHFLGTDLSFDQGTYDKIAAMFAKRNIPLSDSHRQQCFMPEGIQLLDNQMGTAPGMRFEKNGKIGISMPGVPYEMKYIMEHHVLPMLQSMSNLFIRHRTFMTAGTGETVLEDAIEDVVAGLPHYIQISYLPSLGTVRLRITGRHTDETELDAAMSAAEAQILLRIQAHVYGYDGETLPSCIYRLAKEKGITIGTAESCTGGGFAHQLVSIPGSSAYFLGGVVAYSNDIKVKLLGVSPDTLAENGAVSETTVLEMVDGALDALGCDIAISFSGIAGPDGGSVEKPVGTIWCAIGNRQHRFSFLIRAGKDREKNIQYAIAVGMNQLRKFIEMYH